MYYLNKVANKKLNSTIKKILFISISGSILAWIVQLIEIHLYHFEIGVNSRIGLFEDEFTRTWKYFLPTLLLCEMIWLSLRNKLRLVYTGFSIIIIFSFISFYNSFVFPDSNAALYPDLSFNKTDSPNVILIVADDLGYKDISYNGNNLIETKNITINQASRKLAINYTSIIILWRRITNQLKLCHLNQYFISKWNW